MSFDPKVRYDQIGPVKFMARVDGYVMCRRPRCMPFVMWGKDWDKLPHDPDSSVASKEDKS